MAVNEILNTTPLQVTTVQGRERSATPPAQAQAAAVNPAVAAAAASQALTPAQQAALLINQTLQNLSFELPSPLDATAINAANPLLTALDIELTPAQQAALQINATLLNLSRTTPLPVDALLIDETNPLVEATEVAAELTPAQEAAALVNEALQELSAAPPALSLLEEAAAGTLAVGVTQPANPLLAEGALLPTPAAPAVAPTAEAFIVAAGPTAIGTGVGPEAVTLPAATLPPAATTTTTAEPTPTVTRATEPRDPTPFAFAVYEIRDQNPAPAEPTPTRREVVPPLPLGRVRPVDRLVLKREWERRRESGRQEEMGEGMPVAERSIRQVISQANADLLANGLPLRLVLVRSSLGYTLDIYNCSYDDVCRLEKEVPLDLKELVTLLDNIQHESGIIINLKT